MSHLTFRAALPRPPGKKDWQLRVKRRARQIQPGTPQGQTGHRREGSVGEDPEYERLGGRSCRFADTSGNTATNRSLSERGANGVIGYLVTKHNLPLQRLVQPFCYGESKPVASFRVSQAHSAR